MRADREEGRLHREIIRRALERSRAAQEEREGVLFRKDMLDVLSELTGLAPVELEQIADEVMTAHAGNGEGLFSVRNQILFAALFVLTALGIPVLAICLI